MCTRRTRKFEDNIRSFAGKMKLHHLARHNQSIAAYQQQLIEQQRGDLLSTKQQQLQATSTTSQLQKQQQPMNNMSDDEDDELNDNQSYYDIIDQQQQQQQNLSGLQQQASAMNNGTTNLSARPIDSSGFLIDKNKKLFPQKLWELIHNPSIQHCLRWSQDGQRVYLNRNEFEAYYLKTPNNQFHTQKAISFVRQMNMYGFRKVDDCYYENDNFRRDRQHLLRNMIRRHPNKGLFVGLDHHQLAAAAAAQQALQVNQQLQQLEHQHKHRTEQALRLNNYLNSHHQFNQQQASALAAHGHHHHLHHSSPFEHMSSQLAQVAANHLSQHHHNHHHHHHQHQQQQQHHNHHLNQQQQLQGSNPSDKTQDALNVSAHGAINNNHLINNLSNNNRASPLTVHHQPKKSRLLNNFYASSLTNSNNNNNNNNHNNNNTTTKNNNNSSANQMHNQDSMHSTSSVDTQPSQCSSAINSGSAGSPQPVSPTALQHRLAVLTGNNRDQLQQSGSSSSIRAAILAAAAAAGQDGSVQNGLLNKFAAAVEQDAAQIAATDLSNQSLASRQALHQTLVRSLLQLKQQHPQELWASLQQQQQQQQQNQQNSRALLESLASLSSAGTGSIVDPASNSPTERTATPPSSPPSPSALERSNPRNYCTSDDPYLEDNGGSVMALNLAKSSNGFDEFARKPEDDDEYDYCGQREDLQRQELPDADGDETEVEDEDDEVVAGESLANDDIDEKVSLRRRFLDEQLESQRLDDTAASTGARVKREPDVDEDLMVDDMSSRAKRVKLDNSEDSPVGNSGDSESSSVSSMSKSLIIEICDRRGDQLDMSALQEAAKYTECFLEILLEDAALIARHSTSDEDLGSLNRDGNESDTDLKAESIIEDQDGTKAQCNKTKKAGIVDTSSLSLALKLIPSKLLAAIQQQVNIRTNQSSVVA